jgi:hypothetical protein
MFSYPQRLSLMGSHEMMDRFAFPFVFTSLKRANGAGMSLSVLQISDGKHFSRGESSAREEVFITDKCFCGLCRKLRKNFEGLWRFRVYFGRLMGSLERKSFLVPIFSDFKKIFL